MGKEKIYIVSWNGTDDSGGVERVTHYMVQAWKDAYDVELIDFATMRKKPFYRLLLGKHLVTDAILASVYTNHIIRRNKEKKVKIVTQGFNAPWVNADLHFSHGTMRGYKLAAYRDAKWHFSQRFEKKAAIRAKRIVAVGNHVKKEQCELYGTDESKIIILENCIDTDVFFPLKTKKENPILNVLFVGRLEDRKGLTKIIELAGYLENRNDIKLTIATNSNKNIEIFNKFKNVQVKVELKKHEMNEFYNSGDILFFPSLYEGFELVTIEALSAGIPVIGNNVGAVSDLYKRGQKAVGILQSNMEENIFSMIKLAEQFRDYKEKVELHRDMVRNYNFTIYLEKLKKLWN